MKNNKRRLLLLSMAVWLTLLFIWGHSLMPQAVSARESGAFLAGVEELLHAIGIKISLTDHLIRKAAHFTEFALLGFELPWFWSEIFRMPHGKTIGDNFRWRVTGIAFFSGWLAAFLDESIQLLSQRGAMIADVWLDVAGVTFGIGCAFALSFLISAWWKFHVKRQK